MNHHVRRHRFATAGRPAAFTLVEMMIALTIFGLLIAAVVSQLTESIGIGLKAARTLEYARSSRVIIDRLATDVRAAGTFTMFPEFNDRGHAVGDGESGNYVVLQEIDEDGGIVRTIGYYLGPDAAGTGSSLYRHDSDDGSLVPGALPAASTSGTHPAVVRTVRVPDGERLFRNFRQQGVSVGGQFGTADGARNTRLQLVQCTLSTRS